jgi:hypothetical protein
MLRLARYLELFLVYTLITPAFAGGLLKGGVGNTSSYQQYLQPLYNSLDQLNQVIQDGFEERRQERLKAAEQQNQFEINRETIERQIAEEKQSGLKQKQAALLATAERYQQIKAQIVANVGTNFNAYTPTQFAELRKQLLIYRDKKPNRADYDTGKPPNDTYEGETDSQGDADGLGKIWFPSGNFYFGQWSHGKRDGKGLFFFSTGEVFCGTCRSEVAEKGAYWFRSGQIFIGNYVDAVPDSMVAKREGDQILNDNTILEGTFIEGQLEGWGAMIFSNDGFYEGQLRNGKEHGLGVFHFTDGGECVGTWAYGTPTNDHAYVLGNRAAEPSHQWSESGYTSCFSYDFGSTSYTTRWKAANDYLEITPAHPEAKGTFSLPHFRLNYQGQ